MHGCTVRYADNALKPVRSTFAWVRVGLAARAELVPRESSTELMCCVHRAFSPDRVRCFRLRIASQVFRAG